MHLLHTIQWWLLFLHAYANNVYMHFNWIITKQVHAFVVLMLIWYMFKLIDKGLFNCSLNCYMGLLNWYLNQFVIWNFECGLCTTCKVVTSPFHASGKCTRFYSGNQTSVVVSYLCIYMYMLATNRRLPSAWLFRRSQPNLASLHAPGLASRGQYMQMQAPKLEKRTKHTLRACLVARRSLAWLVWQNRPK
jgi:hypothetical protein